MDELTLLQATPKPPQPKKQKRYHPPQPDKHTYASQEEFLDSLYTISLHDVEPQQKCPTCWKPYGEAPDPGFDNSELPVKLQCGHVFGNKCLASTFALPEANRILLEPLSFRVGKKGWELGHMLDRYAKTHGANGRHITEIFANMLATMGKPGTCRDQLAGKYWFSRLQEIQQVDADLASITLMENAIVLDSKPAVPTKWNTTIGTMNNTSLPTPTPPPSDGLNDPTHPHPYSEYGPAPGYCDLPSMFPPPTAAESVELEPEIPQPGTAGHNEAAQETGQEPLAIQTKLDKLAALQKLNKDVLASADQALVDASLSMVALHKAKQQTYHTEQMALQHHAMARIQG